MSETATPTEEHPPSRPVPSMAAVIFGSLLGITIAAISLAGLLLGDIGDGAPDIVIFFGRFHPLILHLPIGGVAYLLFIEITRPLLRKRWNPSPLPALLFTAVTALAAAALGYMLGESGDYTSDKNFLLHFQWGLAFAGFAGLALFFGLLRARGKSKFIAFIYFLSMTGVVATLSVTGHAGASMTHGEEYLTAYAPEPLKSTMEAAFGIEPKESILTSEEIEAIPVTDRQIYAHVVVPILNNHCYSCHSSEMQKSKLRMDSIEALLAGGKEGPAIVLNDPDGSAMIQRMELPLEDEYHMPPKEKTQHEVTHVQVLREWIALGAPADKKLGELEISEEALVAITSGVTAKKVAAPAHGAISESEQLLRKQLQPQVQTLTEKLGGSSLSFTARNSANLSFNGYSIGQNMSAETLAELVPVADHIVEANMAFTSLDDAMLDQLPALPALRRLMIAGTNVTDASIQKIAEKCPNLEVLVAYQTELSDGALQNAAQLMKLEKLVLSLTKVTPEGAAKFRETQPSVDLVTGE